MLTYSRLREIQLKEIASLEPVKLERDFYSQLREFLESKKASVGKAQSLMEMREFENIKKVAKSLVAKRKEKLLMLSAILERDIEGLTEEEQEFMDGVRGISKKSFGHVDDIFEEPKEARAPETRVKIGRAIEAYKGSDNNIYGPFKEGEEVLLPQDEADWLLRSKLAEHMA